MPITIFSGEGHDRTLLHNGVAAAFNEWEARHAGRFLVDELHVNLASLAWQPQPGAAVIAEWRYVMTVRYTVLQEVT